MSLQIIVMGVSGCGKTTVGQKLAEVLNFEYIDGDHYHSRSNIAKMRAGIALTDSDRSDWLHILNQLLAANHHGKVLACSALKISYRQILTHNIHTPIFVYLHGNFDTIWQRLQLREQHFFKGENMLKSQFATLEMPTGDNVIQVDLNQSVDAMIATVIQQLNTRFSALLSR